MPKGLQRHYGQGHLHFVNFSCYHRRPLLGTVRARNLFARILGEVRDRYGFLLVGYVVMPDHVHLLISEPKKGDAFSGCTGAEAKSFASDAREKAQGRRSADAAAVSRGLPCAGKILAEAFLRFQCMEPQEKEGKTGLHAWESGEERASQTPAGMAVEQLFILCLGRNGNTKGRSSGLRKTTKKDPPFAKSKNAKDGPPPCAVASSRGVKKESAERGMVQQPKGPTFARAGRTWGTQPLKTGDVARGLIPQAPLTDPPSAIHHSLGGPILDTGGPVDAREDEGRRGERKVAGG
jgi:REP element-mobilizing transposase RayT